METNVTGLWRMAKAALPHVAASGGGSMILLSSTAGLYGTFTEGGYAVSKAAVNHLAKQLAVQWGPRNIRVNVIAPGTTRTDMIRNHNPEHIKHAVERAPLRRMGEPEDIAAIALFFASEASRHLTGQLLVADGGGSLLGGMA
jgi:NAD(P)-dependent dehydrogenase (short-subunit alcohol dehydrogenase family)